MPAPGEQEKTEQPTPRRRAKAREQGQVAKGREVGTVAVLMSSLLVFYLAGKHMLVGTMGLWTHVLGNVIQPELTPGDAHDLLRLVQTTMANVLLPILAAVFVGAFLANVMQVGFRVTPKAVTPDLSKISPLKGFKRLFSLKSLVELAKNLVKLAVVGVVVYLTVRSEIKGAFVLMDQGPWPILEYIMGTAFDILHRAAWVLLVLAILDYVYQRWEFEKDLKMSKQEVKEEHKQTEGDPHVKSRIRALQREMARRRMMEAVPKAQVVITNPTHVAVALKYEKGMNAPLVLAKGAGFLALRIREVARKHGVPVVENPDVARALFKMAEIGKEIPRMLYRAVAEILAHVFRLRKRASRRR